MWMTGIGLWRWVSTCRIALPASSLCVGLLALQLPGASILHVSADAASGGAGTSWSTAFQDLQAALSAAQPSDEIWVAEGVYHPTSSPVDRDATFQLLDGVGLYGGFSGMESLRTERNPASHETILSGDVLENDTSGSPFSFDDNSYTVVTGSGVDFSAVLDGFTVERGFADGETREHPSSHQGAGMYNETGSPTVANCAFRHNFARSFGGGMANLASSHPIVTDCVFAPNFAGDGGGGMVNRRSHPIVRRTDFVGNEADPVGGAIDSREGSRPFLTDCFFGESVARFGGAMYIESNAAYEITVVNCRFERNLVTRSLLDGLGGAVFLAGPANTSFINCVFLENNTWGFGGAVYASGDGRVSFVNSTFADNRAWLAAGAVIAVWGCEARFANSILWGNVSRRDSQIATTTGGQAIVSHTLIASGEVEFAGNGNVFTDPLFVDLAGGDLRPLPGSPAIDTGDDSAVPIGITTDLDGNPRIAGSAVDMGAFEAIWAVHGDVLDALLGMLVPEPISAFDFNGDGIVDAGDLVRRVNIR